MVTLIADSGSTKTDWIVTSPAHGICEIHTQGINPVRDSANAIVRIIQDELLPALPADDVITQIHFFGAGCIVPFSQPLIEVLSETFPQACIHVDSDLMGAAIALCGREPGVACILGTGANSCLFDGERIVQNVSPMGFILGDEGSGAVLGKTLLGELMKGDLPDALREEFLTTHSLTLSTIIDRVYRQPQPNRFLASLVPFIADHRDLPQIHQMLVTAFRQFFSRNVRHYNVPHMPVNFVGSIAYIFSPELHEAADAEGFTIGKILRQPAQEIAKCYQNTCSIT